MASNVDADRTAQEESDLGQHYLLNTVCKNCPYS